MFIVLLTLGMAKRLKAALAGRESILAQRRGTPGTHVNTVEAVLVLNPLDARFPLWLQKHTGTRSGLPRPLRARQPVLAEKDIAAELQTLRDFNDGVGALVLVLDVGRERIFLGLEEL